MDYRPIHPKGNFVLVRVPDVEEEVKTKSGLVLAKSVETIKNEKITQEIGTIVEIGPLAYEDYESKVGAGDGTERWKCEVGEVVLFARQGGKKVDHPHLDPSLRLLNDTDILAGIG